MTRARLIRVAVALTALAVLGGGLVALVVSDAGAQGKSGAAFAANNKAERKALALLEKNRLVTARRVAEEILKDNEESMVGHYVVGRVLHEADGSLARAMYHLGHARELYEDTYETHPRPPSAPWQFHRELLFAIQKLAAQMEKFKYQLKILKYYDALYNPDLTAEHAWPLMRLGRFKKARKYARKVIKSEDAQQRSLGLNSMCAIEGEARTRKKYFKACLAALKNARAEEAGRPAIDKKHESTLAIHAYNAALAARTSFEPKQAEDLAIEGTTRLAFSPANPWRFLARLYTDQGRMNDAIKALREMQSWRTKQPPMVRVQARAETDVAFATVLLVAARTDIALPVVDRALERPDRRGLTSVSPEQTKGAHALLRRAMRLTHAEMLAERASWSETGERVKRTYRRAERAVLVRVDELRIINVLSDDQRLLETFRVFTRGGIEPVPVWLLGDLVEVLGPGLVSVVLRKVRKLDKDPRIKPYCDAIEADVALARGDEDEAIRLARLALRKLPRNEALLRARMAAVGAKAAKRGGNKSLHLTLLSMAMQIDPSVIRRMGMTLPVRISVSATGAAADMARQLLERSPRLDIGENGFKLIIKGRGRSLQACLRSPYGATLSCAFPSIGKKEKRTDDLLARRLAEAVHQRCLAMPLGLSGTDLSSLDGRTTVADQAVRQQLKGILDEVVKTHGK